MALSGSEFINSDAQSNSSFLFKGQKKEFLDWLESLRISKYWLDTLSIGDAFSLCKEVYHILQHITELELTVKERLSVLIEIDSCLQGLCEKLQTTYLGSSFPLEKDKQEYVNIIISSYFVLAQGYQEIMHDKEIKSLSKSMIALNVCRGLKALEVVFLACAEVYTEPEKGFWKIYYRLLSHSNIFNVLNTKAKIDNKPCTANILFKQILIFYILDRYQFTAKELKKIFNALFTVSRYIEFKKEPTPSGTMIGFYLERDDFPSKLNPNAIVSTKTLSYINIFDVAKVLQVLIHESKLKESNNVEEQHVYSLALKALEQKDKTYRQIQKKYHCHTLIGVHQIVEFLLEKENKIATERHKQEREELQKTQHHEDEFDSLKLMLDWDDNDTEDEITESQNSLVTEGVQITESSMEGYTLLWEKEIGIKLQIGELIGLIPDFRTSRNRVEIGLIRRMKITSEGIMFKVELIGLESTLVYIEKKNSFAAGEWLLFLFGSPKYEVSIVCSTEYDYEPGEDVSVQLSDDKMADCKLGELLNSTALINHIALKY